MFLTTGTILKTDWTLMLTRGPNDLFKQLFQQFGCYKKKGLRWRSRRRLLTPAFHFQILESFFDVFNDQSQQLIKELDSAAARPAASVDGSVNVYKILTQCALDIICGWPTFLLFF
jgi:cytochrome P450